VKLIIYHYQHIIIQNSISTLDTVQISVDVLVALLIDIKSL